MIIRVLLLILLIPNILFSAEYYLSPDGDGTDGLTWATADTMFSSAIVRLSGGDTLVYAPTQYTNSWFITSAVSGSPAGETIIIDSTRHVNGWNVSYVDTSLWVDNLIGTNKVVTLSFEPGAQWIRVIGLTFVDCLPAAVTLKTSAKFNKLNQCQFKLSQNTPQSFISLQSSASVSLFNCLLNTGDRWVDYGVRASGANFALYHCTFYGTYFERAIHSVSIVLMTAYGNIIQNTVTPDFGIYRMHSFDPFGLNYNFYLAGPGNGIPIFGGFEKTTDLWDASSFEAFRDSLNGNYAIGKPVYEVNSKYGPIYIKNTSTTCIIDDSSPAWNSVPDIGYGRNGGYFQRKETLGNHDEAIEY